MASERDRQAYRAWQAELAAEEAAEKERVERPIREAAAELSKLHGKLYKIVRDRLENSVDEDEWGTSQVYVSPAVAGRTMPWDDAVAFVVSEYRKFIAHDSEWYWDSNQNRAALFSYLDRNGIQISDAEMLRRAARRLNEYNILELRPVHENYDPETGAIIVPREEPYQSTDPNAPKYVNLERAPAPVTHQGWDEQTGQERLFSDYEVNRMSSEAFLKAFRLGRTFSSGVPVRNVMR